MAVNGEQSIECERKHIMTRIVLNTENYSTGGRGTIAKLYGQRFLIIMDISASDAERTIRLYYQLIISGAEGINIAGNLGV